MKVLRLKFAQFIMWVIQPLLGPMLRDFSINQKNLIVGKVGWDDIEIKPGKRTLQITKDLNNRIASHAREVREGITYEEAVPPAAEKQKEDSPVEGA